jgi:hypothetical protein
MKIKYAIKNLFRNASMALAITAALAAVVLGQDTSADDPREPDLPCSEVRVPAGNKVAFRAYAIGVQVYRWNGAAWDFVAPVAKLYADANYNGKIATHYAGPTWESNSGSKVVATRDNGCDPDLTAISWLRLRKVSTEGPGILAEVTFIQRVNTTGGLRPTVPGTVVGSEAKVPYTAEYYFYRKED